MALSVHLQLGKFLVITGAVLVTVGLLVMAATKLSFLGLGRLPGDIIYKSKHGAFYFPVVTCLVVSALLTLVLWVISLLTKR
jgi:hypothetical protein